MGIIGYLKLGVVGAIIAGLLYLGWNYEHMKTQLKERDDRIASLEEQQRVMQDKQETFESFMKKSTIIKRKVEDDKEANTEAVSSGNADNVISRARAIGVRGANKTGNPANGKPSGTRPSAESGANTGLDR
jgi:hypothetical protein